VLGNAPEQKAAQAAAAVTAHDEIALAWRSCAVSNNVAAGWPSTSAIVTAAESSPAACNAAPTIPALSRCASSSSGCGSNP
jgi:hypothetical protein